jgi:predicted carbohydrate-binding protein with CBM5 and CBM33 domain
MVSISVSILLIVDIVSHHGCLGEPPARGGETCR